MAKPGPFSEAHKAALKRAGQDPQLRRLRSENAKKMWASRGDELRQTMLEAKTTEAFREKQRNLALSLLTPEERERRRVQALRQWAERRDQMVKAQRSYYQHRRAKSCR